MATIFFQFFHLKEAVLIIIFFCLYGSCLLPHESALMLLFFVLPHIVTYTGLQFESFCLSLLKIWITSLRCNVW